jgi:hypothetical protein
LIANPIFPNKFARHPRLPRYGSIIPEINLRGTNPAAANINFGVRRGVEASAPMAADGDWRRRRKQTPNKQSSLAMAIALEGWTAI